MDLQHRPLHVASNHQIEGTQGLRDALVNGLPLRQGRFAQHVVDNFSLDSGVPDAKPQALEAG